MKGAIGSARLKVLVVIAILSLPAQAALGGGFSIFEQGSKPLGLACAVVAQADDPSTLFYNSGGLAFFREREFAAGITLVNSFDESFVGLPPFPGPMATGKLNSLAEPIPHFYWIEPINESWKFGLALNAPFGLKTDWSDPDNFPGRFINTEASMVTVDLTPAVGVQLSSSFGLGFGAIVRFSSVEFNRRIPFQDPFSGALLEVGSARLESDLDTGLGWHLGWLHKPSERFSWGFNYRSRVTVEYGGDARFTQTPTGNPMLDRLLAATIPFDQNLAIKTEIEFPDMATLGVAFGLGSDVLLEIDVNWTGWSSFDTLEINFEDASQFDIVRPENWEDIYTFRVGLAYNRPSGQQWRFGFVTDPSPQPTAAVSPLLPDTDRNGYSIGWGREGARSDVDVAFMYLDFEDRVNDLSQDGFNGIYSQSGWLISLTVGF